MAVDLRAYGLKANPFPLQPGSTVTTWAGRPDERELLFDIVRTPLANDIGTSEFAVIHGDYGAGKSHSMRFFASLINNDTSDQFSSIAIYVPTIKMDQRTTSLRLYREVMQIVGDTRVRTLASTILSSFVRATDDFKKKLTKEQLLADEGSDQNVRESVLHSIDQADVPMVQLMLSIAQGDDDALAYLRGSGKAMPALGFAQPVNSDFAASKTLGGFLRVLTLSIEGQEPACLATYLFLDEVESIMEDRPTDLQQFFQGIRNLVNELPYHFCLLMSFSADTALMEAIIPQAVLQRMTRPYIELSTLEPDDAKDFIAELLRDHRPESFSCTNKFHPFTEESVELVLERIAQITPRQLFRMLNTILIRSIQREGLVGGQEISTGMAEDILAAGGYH